MTKVGTAWGVLCVLAIASLPPAEATPSAPFKRLHLPLTSDLTDRTGRQPSMLGEPVFAEHSGHPCLRLPATVQKPGVESPAAIIAEWPAREVLDNAQGTVAFWVRAQTHTPSSTRPPTPVLQIINTGGGKWAFHVFETAYQEPKGRPESISQEEIAASLDASISDGLQQTPTKQEQEQLDDELAPQATLFCQLKTSPFGVSKIAALHPTHTAQKHTQRPREWHHVLWTWRSVHHRIYIDGQMMMTASATKSISRMAPIVHPEARLQLAASPLDVRDLRVYDRYLEPSVAATLNHLGVSDDITPPAPIRTWVDWGGLTGRAVVYSDVRGLPDTTSVRAECFETGSGRVLAAVDSPVPGSLGESLLRATQGSAFPPGTYQIKTTAHDAKGTILTSAESAPWTQPKEKQPWQDFVHAGDETTDRILPPFAAIQAQGHRLNTVALSYTLDRSGLLANVEAANDTVLAGAIELQLVSNNQHLPFAKGVGLEPIANHSTSASWQANTASEEGHRLQVKGELLYDGVCQFDVTLTPKGALAVDQLVLRIPFAPEHVEHAHLGWSYSHIALDRGEDGSWQPKSANWRGWQERPRRPNVLFDANDLANGLFPPPAHSPYPGLVHVGSPQRGLTWFVDNDQGWIHAPDVPAMEFTGHGDSAALQFHIIAQPTVLKQPHRFRFYLLGNPFKPLPKNWRAWVIGDHSTTRNQLHRNTTHQFFFRWSEYARSYYPYPGGAQGRSYEDWLGAFKDSTIRQCPFVNFGVPAGSGLYGNLDAHAVIPYDWKLANTRPHQDYMLYWFDKCIRDIGIAGVYIDEPYSPQSTYNVLAGDHAYIRPDGTRGMGYRFMEGREYIRRFKSLFHSHGMDHSVWLHTTNFWALPLYTFADISMDGEHPQIWVPEFDRYHSFYNPTRSRSYISGLTTGVVGCMMYHHTTDPRPGPDRFARLQKKARQYLAVTLPYGVLPMFGGIPTEYNRIQNIRDAFGVAVPAIEELAMNEHADWLPGSTLAPDVRAIRGIRHPNEQRALLYLSGPESKHGTELRFDGGVQGLNLGKPHNHVWDAETGVSLATDAGVRIRLGQPEGFACIWIAGRDEPQPTRPENTLLKVTFQSGTTPDFGAGIRPPTTSNNTPAVLAPGETGKALQVSRGDSAIGYPIVPPWLRGRLEMRVKFVHAPSGPIRIFELAHHLNVSLHLVSRDGQAGLLLRSKDHPFSTIEGLAKDVTTEISEQFVPLPGLDDAWHDLKFSWQSGHYVLSLDNDVVHAHWQPSRPSLRDAVALANGVWLGDGSGKPGATVALIDSVAIYNQANDDQATFSVNAMAHNLQTAYVHTDFVTHEARRTFDLAVRFSVVDPENGNTVASQIAHPWRGSAWAMLSLQENSAPEGSIDDDDELELGGEQRFVIRAELCATKREQKTVSYRPLAMAETTLELNPLELLDLSAD